MPEVGDKKRVELLAEEFRSLQEAVEQLRAAAESIRAANWHLRRTIRNIEHAGRKRTPSTASSATIIPLKK